MNYRALAAVPSLRPWTPNQLRMEHNRTGLQELSEALGVLSLRHSQHGSNIQVADELGIMPYCTITSVDVAEQAEFMKGESTSPPLAVFTGREVEPIDKSLEQGVSEELLARAILFKTLKGAFIAGAMAEDRPSYDRAADDAILTAKTPMVPMCPCFTKAIALGIP
jgi:hypothetical protein